VYAGTVKRLSHGTLEVKVVEPQHAGQQAFESATIRDLQHGRGDLAVAGTRAWGALGARRLRAFDAPLLIDSYPLEERVLRSGLVAEMLADLRPLGLTGIGILAGELRKPIGARHRLLVPVDFRGLVIGTQQSATADATMRALGARPARLSAAPEMGTLSGLELQLSAIESSQLDAPGTHISGNVNLWPRALVLAANARVFAKLTTHERQILRAAASGAVAGAIAGASHSDDELAANICRRGRATFDTATPAQLRALRDAVDPVYAELRRDPVTRELLAAIAQLKLQLNQPPSGLEHCAHQPSAPASRRTPLDGSWRMDTNRSAAVPEYFAENWGHWIFVFDRGRFAITQENVASCTWGYGTFTVHGHRATWRFTDGGGQAPNEAVNRPGEQFSFGLSSYRDTLTLSPVAGEISPLNFRARPWRRLSGPSRSALSKHCPPPAEALQP
jgi:TRAP-type C4-dicarboxylate transport system substrate-binding protein